MKNFEFDERVKSEDEKKRFSEIDSSVSKFLFRFTIIGRITFEDVEILEDFGIFCPDKSNDEIRFAYKYDTGEEIDVYDLARKIRKKIEKAREEARKDRLYELKQEGLR